VLDLEASVPGSGSVVQLDLVSPPVAGEYLLLLDVVSPAHGSLSALGNAPALVRVSVAAAPAASPEPAPATPDPRD
jgi:hypothetical protein